MRLSIIAMAIALAGCSTTEYAQYANTQTAIATSRATAETSRYDALARIAESGDSSARIAAVMAIAMGQGAAQQQQQIAAPTPAGTTALQWASVLVPGLTQVYGIQQNAKVAINSSNNAASTSQATTAGFVGIAGLIQAAPTITTTTDRHDVISPAPVVVTPVTVIEPTVITPVVQVVPVIQPTVTP